MNNVTNVNPRRKTSKPTKCPNPLFEKWLDEWKIEAANRNSNLQYSFGKALQSLRKYPIKLNSGRECLILKNFGTQLCVKLDRKLAEYQKNNPEDTSLSVNEIIQTSTVQKKTSPKKPIKRKAEKNAQNSESSDNVSLPNTKKNKSYIPNLRSSPYAILITLHQEQNQPNCREYLLKADIQQKAQLLCDSSFTKPDPGSHYTAWSSMSTLVKKGLVISRGSPAKYSLTIEGKELAYKLYTEMITGTSSTATSSSKSPVRQPFRCSSSDEYSPVKHRKDTVSSDSEMSCIDLTDDHIRPSSISQPVPLSGKEENIINEKRNYVNAECTQNSCSSTLGNDFEQLIFSPDEFEIVLLVDTQETTAKAKNPLAEDTVQELTNLKTRFEVRHLKVGDFAWISRGRNGKELMLPYIVERKRMDDLCDSIKDGRFHEQKFRLHQCGLPNVIYLIEKYGNEAQSRFPVSTLNQAAVNTQIVDHFMVKYTNDHRHSMMYLSVMTKLLTDVFKDKTLISCLKSNLPTFDFNDEIMSLITFEEFAKSSTKNKKYKIQEMFIKQLLQLKGLSTEKALAITALYPTPRSLISAFIQSDKKDLMLSNMQYGTLNRNIGPVISKSIYRLYCDLNLN